MFELELTDFGANHVVKDTDPVIDISNVLLDIISQEHYIATTKSVWTVDRSFYFYHVGRLKSLTIRYPLPLTFPS